MYLRPIDGGFRWLGTLAAINFPQLNTIQFSITFDATAIIEAWQKPFLVRTADNRKFDIEASGTDITNNEIYFIVRFDTRVRFPNVNKLTFFGRDACPDLLQVC